MSRARFILLVIAVIFAVCGIWGSWQAVQSLEAELTALRNEAVPQHALVTVPVARKDLLRGSLLSAEDFSTLELPVALLPEGFIQNLPAFPEGEGQVALMDLQAGRLLPNGAIVGAQHVAQAGLTLAAGDNVIAVKLANYEQMKGYLESGAAIDLFWRRLNGEELELRLIGRGLQPQMLGGALHSRPPLPSAEPEGALLDVLPQSELANTTWVSAAPSDIGPEHAPLAPRSLVEMPFTLLTGTGEEIAALLLIGEEGALFASPVGPEGSSADALLKTAADLLALPIIGQTTLPVLAELQNAGPSVPPLCQMAIIRAASRIIVEVPCSRAPPK